MKSYAIGLFFSLISFSSLAINDSIVKPQIRNSPIMIANLKNSENHYIKCTYGQPLKKGRDIFGNLVPYNKLWRTGANEATEITFTSNIKIGETSLVAGTYTLFSIPNKEKWTIILNSELGQWGDFGYDSTKNVLKYEAVASINTDIYEGFTIYFEDKTGGFNMYLAWDNVKIQIPINTIGEIQLPNNKRKRKRAL